MDPVPRTRFWRSHNFISDSWKLTQKVTMVIGVHYEYNPAIKDSVG